MLFRRDGEPGERRPHAEPGERIAVAVLAAASVVGALSAGVHPTANRISDALLVVAFAAGVVAAASVARATAWLIAGGLAAAFASGGWAVVAGVALVAGLVGAA